MLFNSCAYYFFFFFNFVLNRLSSASHSLSITRAYKIRLPPFYMLDVPNNDYNCIYMGRVANMLIG